MKIRSPGAILPSGQDEENYRRIRQIMSYIAEHYSEKILLNDVADLIHLSPSECSRLFKKLYDITLFGYIQEYRIERSLEYLENPSCSITESGLLSGFSDSNYYTKIFYENQGLYTKTVQKKIRSCDMLLIFNRSVLHTYEAEQYLSVKMAVI